MHESEKWKCSRSVVSDSWRPHGPQPTRLFCPQEFPGESTGVGCHCLLHLANGICPKIIQVPDKHQLSLFTIGTLWVKRCPKKFTCINSLVPGTIKSIFQMGKLRNSRISNLLKHRAGKWQCRDEKPGCPAAEPALTWPPSVSNSSTQQLLTHQLPQTQVWTGGRLGKNAEALTYLQISFCFSFWLCHLACGNPCSPTRDQTHTPCIGSSESHSLGTSLVSWLLTFWSRMGPENQCDTIWRRGRGKWQGWSLMSLHVFFFPPYLRPFNESTYIMVIIIADIKWMISRC